MRAALLATIGMVSLTAPTWAASTDMSWVVRSHHGHGTSHYGSIEAVEYPAALLDTLPENVRGMTVYCTREWTGLVAEVGGRFYALNGKAKGRDITVVQDGRESAVLPGYEGSAPFADRSINTIPLITPALNHCGHYK